MFCISLEPNHYNFIKNLEYLPVGLGGKYFDDGWFTDTSGINISKKNKNYGEYTYHYWIWKNYLDVLNNDEWIGTCQYRRFFVKKEFGEKTKNKYHGFYNIKNIDELKSIIQIEPVKEWNDYDVILCNPYNLSGVKKIKLIKRGFRSLMKDPSIFFKKNKQTIKLHFEMHHGYSKLEKASRLLPRGDETDFLSYVSTKTSLIGNCIFISRNKKIMSDFYTDLFTWLFKCEEIFGFKGDDYDTKRIYSFLTERYMPFWFEKYSNVLTWPWVFFDISKFEN